jgi:hypothetical protein
LGPGFLQYNSTCFLINDICPYNGFYSEGNILKQFGISNPIKAGGMTQALKTRKPSLGNGNILII